MYLQRKAQQLLLLITAVVFSTPLLAFAAPKPVRLTSPNGLLVISVIPGKQLAYSVTYKGEEVVAQSAIGLVLADGKILGQEAEIDKKRERSVNTQAKGNFYKKAVVPNAFNELELDFSGGYGLVLRAYDDGYAYRFTTTLKGKIQIRQELFEAKLPAQSKLFAAYHKKRDFYFSFENVYDTTTIEKLDTGKIIMSPLLAVSPKGNRILLTESDLEDYPGLNFKKNDPASTQINGAFAPVVLAIKGVASGKAEYDLTRPTKLANYIAETDGNRHYPWRVGIVADQDVALANSDLIYLLARPAAFEDMSWIKPGKAVWEWWNNWNVTGLDFKAGVNTATYKYYIDHAAANKLEYVVLDEGWSTSLATMLDVKPDLDLVELTKYAKSKNVGLILWGTGYALDKDMQAVFEKYSKLGIKGFKIDFLDRDDQYMVNFCERALKEGYKYKMLIDFHGVSKPTGLNRTYPNEINREGVFGNEQNKWSNDLTTYQQVVYPYIRMVQGHADFTPGAMRNAINKDFRPIFNQPMAQGTRAHQLAMYLVYDGPLQMLCDAPQAYLADRNTLTFLSEVPTIWDETKVISGVIGQHIAVAKKKGDKWYIGIMAHKSADLTIDCSFLPRGQFDVTLYQDGINIDRNATDLKVTQTTTNAKATLKLAVPAQGGAIYVLTPQ